MSVITNNPIDLADVAAELDVDLEDDVQLDLRGLVMSNGLPYILIALADPETGGVDVTHLGIDPEVIPAALREIADLLDA